jgi:hypothetical protein
VAIENVDDFIPRLARSGQSTQQISKARISHRKVLRAMVEAAEDAAARGHAAPEPSAFFKKLDTVASVMQRSRACDTRQPRPNNR